MQGCFLLLFLKLEVSEELENDLWKTPAQASH